MLTDKMSNVLSTKAEVCSAGDSSCLMHIGGGLTPLRAGVRTVQAWQPPDALSNETTFQSGTLEHLADGVKH